MDDETIRRLNALNRAFYALTAHGFDESRGRPWPGWKRLLPHLRAPLRVLDVGCGNGRFGRFLARHLSGLVHYHGLDNNPQLLDAARVAFQTMGILPDARLEQRDLVESQPESAPDPAGERYDLVAIFGVLHHLPGAAFRRELIRRLAQQVASGGLLVYTSWRFHDHARFRERIAPWPEGWPREPGDFLLDWRRDPAIIGTALRYCHHIDATEQAALDAASGLYRIDSFLADGHTDDINCYSVLRAPN